MSGHHLDTRRHWSAQSLLKCHNSQKQGQTGARSWGTKQPSRTATGLSSLVTNDADHSFSFSSPGVNTHTHTRDRPSGNSPVTRQGHRGREGVGVTFP